MSKGGSSSSQPSGIQTQTSTTSPWAGQQPYLLQGFNQAQNLFNQGGAQYYPGQTFAGPTDAQLQGYQAEANLGQYGTPAQQQGGAALGNILNPSWLTANPGSPYYQSAAQGGMNVNTGNLYEPLATGQQTNMMGVPELQNFASGEYTSANNPYFQQMAGITAANVLPQIQGAFNTGNRLDSGLASRAASYGLGDAIGGLAYNNYNQQLQQQQAAANQLAGIGQQNIGNQLAASNALTQLGLSNVGNQLAGAQGLGSIFQSGAQNQLEALGQVPGFNQMAYNQAAALQEAGGNLQQQNQAAINAAVQRWNYGQQLPYQNLQQYMQNLAGSYGGQGQTSTPFYQNSAMNDLSSALGGSILGKQLGSGLFGNQTFNAAPGLSNIQTDASGLTYGIPNLSSSGSPGLFSRIGSYLGF